MSDPRLNLAFEVGEDTAISKGWKHAPRLRSRGSYCLTSGCGQTLRHSPWIDAQLLHAGN